MTRDRVNEKCAQIASKCTLNELHRPCVNARTGKEHYVLRGTFCPCLATTTRRCSPSTDSSPGRTTAMADHFCDCQASVVPAPEECMRCAPIDRNSMVWYGTTLLVAGRSSYWSPLGDYTMRTYWTPALAYFVLSSTFSHSFLRPQVCRTVCTSGAFFPWTVISTLLPGFVPLTSPTLTLTAHLCLNASQRSST